MMIMVNGQQMNMMKINASRGNSAFHFRSKTVGSSFCIRFEKLLIKFVPTFFHIHMGYSICASKKSSYRCEF